MGTGRPMHEARWTVMETLRERSQHDTPITRGRGCREAELEDLMLFTSWVHL